MVVKRKRSTYKYIIAGLLTLLVFGLGISMGMLLDNERVQWLEEREEQRDLDYESLQFQYLYLSTLENTEETCKLLKTSFDKSLKDLDLTLSKLLTYKKGTDINEEEYSRLQRRYILDNIEFWLFAKEAKAKCDNVDLVTILYFYSENHCFRCSEQGVALTYYKKIFEEKLLIFPIDMDLEEIEPMITLLKSQFDITDKSFPTIIISDKKFENVVPIKELGELICSEFKTEPEACKSFQEQINNT